jgi:hypothetical protein
MRIEGPTDADIIKTRKENSFDTGFFKKARDFV